MSGRPWWASPEGAERGDGRGGGDGDGEGEQHQHQHRPDAPREVCQVCPICALLRAVGDVRPELIEHLTEAARHLTLAAKAFIDAQAAAYEDDGLEHIPVDEG